MNMKRLTQIMTSQRTRRRNKPKSKLMTMQSKSNIPPKPLTLRTITLHVFTLVILWGTICFKKLNSNVMLISLKKPAITPQRSKFPPTSASSLKNGKHVHWLSNTNWAKCLFQLRKTQFQKKAHQPHKMFGTVPIKVLVTNTSTVPPIRNTKRLWIYQSMGMKWTI